MKYYLHYVGSKLYPKEIFIKEAEAVGVNRCLPLRMIKKLSWGDRILLGIFIPKEIEITYHTNLQGEQEKDQDLRKNKTGGRAEIFGYFDIRGLNIIASDEFKKTLTSQLNVIESKEINQRIQRQCGSYTVGTSHIVTNSIKEIIEKAIKLSDERQEKVKFFVAGKFYTYKSHVEPINFTRTIIEIQDVNELPTEKSEEKTIGEIKDYNKRAYIKKQEKRGRPRKEK